MYCSLLREGSREDIGEYLVHFLLCALLLAARLAASKPQLSTLDARAGCIV